MPLEPLTETDLALILPWRNAPVVRQAMVSHHAISLGEHRAWFQRLQQDPSRRWYLYRNAANAPQGVVYFTELDPAQGTAFWGLYAKPGAAPGTGTSACAPGWSNWMRWPGSANLPPHTQHPDPA